MQPPLQPPAQPTDPAVVPPAVRRLAPEDLERALTLLALAFGQSPQPADVDVELAVADPARLYGAYDDTGGLVGTAGSFALSMTVPGAVLPVAGVTWVGVDQTVRRQGVLRAFMERQLADLHAAGTAVAALWASQGAIYQRFGYGPATWHLSVSLPRGAAFRSPVPAGRLRRVAPTAEALAPAYDVVAAASPGWPARDAAWWRHRLHDPEHSRGGGTPLQCVVTDGGYALYSRTSAWTDGVPAGTAVVRELVAADEGARARLWRHLLDLDLVGELTCRLLPLDDPLLHLLEEPRLARARLSEGLWVRLVDVRAALAARCYAADVDVVLEVRDAQCPWNTGTWRLTGDRAGATCAPAQGPADLVLDVADLGAAYLGGTTLLARRAQVEERSPGALALTSTAFGPLGVAPSCPMIF